MSHIVLLGASGYTGRLLAEVLDRRGTGFVAAGRDHGRVQEQVGQLGAVQDVVQADASDPGSLRALLADADVLVTTVGPFTTLGRPVLEAAVATGTHYVDSTAELPFVRWAFDEIGPAARHAGVTAVPAAAHDFLPGDLLSALACGALDAPREVHVTYLVKARGPLPGYTTAGTRDSIAEVFGEPAVALVDGVHTEERLAEQRRLAWFPKPVGPHHAAGYPGTEPLTVPRHQPGVATVRTYLAIPTVAAELAQATAALASSSERIRDLMRHVLRASDRDPSPTQRNRARWACVAEAADGQGRVARAWMNGRDIYAFTAHALAIVTEALASGPEVSGVVGPAEVLDPAPALDALADAAGARWGLKRPDGAVG